MQQAADFLEECDTLYGLLQNLDESDFEKTTAFKGWTINDVLVHLHFWNRAADLSLTDGDRLIALVGDVFAAPTLRGFENDFVPERGLTLLELWHSFYNDMAERWIFLDPKLRVKWAGPDMSVRSSITARQMEHWAHGQEIFDLLGKDRPESDRIKNVVILGVNTFRWSFKVQGQPTPEHMPSLELTSPSGNIWKFGEANNAGYISGLATEFCQVVTQTRNIADTALHVEGDIAKTWMEKAQCFAGPPETPPASGSRRKTVA